MCSSAYVGAIAPENDEKGSLTVCEFIFCLEDVGMDVNNNDCGLFKMSAIVYFLLFFLVSIFYEFLPY